MKSLREEMAIGLNGVLCWSTMVAVLGGCGGGGGGSTVPIAPVATAFTSWTAVPPNTKVTAGAVSQTTNFTIDGTDTVTSVSASSAPDTAASSAALTFGPNFSVGPNPEVTALQFTTPSGSVSWDATVTGGGTIACGGGTCTASKSGAEGLFIDPYATSFPAKPAAWEYQSFGVWTTTAGTSGTFGAISFGAPTLVGAMPTNLIATYTGLTAGVYVNPAGRIFGTAATLNATVNFDTRSVTFGTFDTVVCQAGACVLGGPAPVLTPGLNLSGTTTYALGATQFVVTNLATQNGQLTSGTATGRFYGLAAEEIGGVYSLRGAGVEAMGGAFGGKR